MNIPWELSDEIEQECQRKLEELKSKWLSRLVLTAAVIFAIWFWAVLVSAIK